MYRSGTRRRSGGITVLQAHSQSAVPEIGIVAGKRVGNAVKRNRAKRRLREAADRVDLAPHTSYVVVASHEVVNAPFGDLTEWLRTAIALGARARNKDWT
jgi:ribonuclease P protein component